jgi:ectoine hydroxylase-related dioxygenase (phytanoyl-CoA dioxygenase family)
MAVRHLMATATPDEVAGALRSDGVVVVDSLVEPAVMDAVCDELRPWVEATPTGPDDFSGHNTRRTGALIARSETARGLVMNPLVLNTVGNVLGHSTNHQLHLTQLISIGPGEPAQTVHRDQWAFDFFPFPAGYDVQCNTIWAATDFTEENGATRVVPGSNHFQDKLRLAAADTEPAEMAKGSVLFYLGSLYHGAGANESSAVRVGVNITYALAWLRQEENQYLSVPHDIARDLPVELLKLMGYTRGAYALGYIDDLRDPIAVLRPDLDRVGLGDS